VSGVPERDSDRCAALQPLCAAGYGQGGIGACLASLGWAGGGTCPYVG
jgi:hypothetical protein